jgi:hypothetical protein
MKEKKKAPKEPNRKIRTKEERRDKDNSNE